MNIEEAIRTFAQEDLAVNHKTDVVRFVDRVLWLACEVQEIQCNLMANQAGLRFLVPGFPAWEVEIERAKAKLRMMCARLAVLCQESGGQEFIIYGGEGVIDQSSVASVPMTVGAGSNLVNGSPVAAAPRVSRDRSSQWAVETKNTMGEQFFKIRAL